VTTGGRLFHARAAATPNARSPMVRGLVRGTMSLWRDDLFFTGYLRYYYLHPSILPRNKFLQIWLHTPRGFTYNLPV